MDLTDPQLMARIAGGDADAFAAFYDRHAPCVFGLLRKLLPQPRDAEDVLQETFSQVWRQAGRYDQSRGSPRSWLLMLARSRALDALRRQRPASDLAAVADLLTQPDFTGTIEQRELMEFVRSALARLPEEQRSVILLTFYSGLTQQQVADLQSLPLGTVKTRIRLAMGRLRSLLKEPYNEVSAS